jgi:hypothetical protein
VRSRAFRRAIVERNRMIGNRAARATPDLFADVHTFCVFIGHNKSGTSLLGGLLDAHPRVVLADEADALRYVEVGIDRDALGHILLRSSRTELRKGRVTARRLEPYSYLVPGQSQGRTEHPVVFGDSTSGTSTRRLGERPELIARLQALGMEVRMIQVVRNPFDPIAAMAVRSGRSLDDVIARYFAACETLRNVREYFDAAALLPVRYEDVIADPAAQLRRTCAYLGVSAMPEYVEACTSILHTRPDRSRERVPWDRSQIGTVECGIARFDFLDGYSYAH